MPPAALLSNTENKQKKIIETAAYFRAEA